MDRLVNSAHQADDRARTEHFEDWPDEVAIEAKNAVLAITESSGWAAIQTAIKLEIDSIQRRLLDSYSPLESTADYEAKLGEIRGLERVEHLVDGLIMHGQLVEETNA